MDGSVPVYGPDGVTIIKRRSPHAPPALIKYAQRKRNVLPKDTDYNTNLKNALIYALENTRTLRDAAKEMGVSSSTIHRWQRDWQIVIDR